MASRSNYIVDRSTAMVLYNPRLPHVSVKSYLEERADEAYRRSLGVAQFEMEHLIVCPSQLDPQKALKARPRRLHHVLPALKGSYAVGHARLSKNNFGDRGIEIEIYAPTRRGMGNRLLMQLRSDQDSGKVLSDEQVHTLYTHSFDRIDPVGKRPCVIFSHGWGVDSVAYRPLLEELASHGYVILGINHFSSSRPYPASLAPEKENELAEQLGLEQANNIRFVVDQVRRGTLKGVSEIISLDRIVLTGHSLGGAASVLVSQSDPDIAGCINIDGALVGDEKSKGLRMPLLMIFADHLKDQEKGSEEGRQKFQKQYAPMLQQWQALYNNSKDVRVGQIKGIGHTDFCVFPLLDWLVGEETLGVALKAHKVASQAVLKFIASCELTYFH